MFRPLEIRAIKLQRHRGLLRRYEVRERIRKAQFCCDGRTPRTGTQQPNFGRTGHVRRNLDSSEGMLGRKIMMKKRQQFKQLLFKIVILDAVAAVTPQGESFEAASSGRAADAKI